MTGKQANKYLTNIDLCNNELLNVKVEMVNRLPVSAEEGRLVYLIDGYKDGEKEYTGESVYVYIKTGWCILLSGIQLPEFEKAIEDLWKAKVDKQVKTELGISRVTNEPNDFGAALKFEHEDGFNSAVAVHNGGQTGIGAEIYALDKRDKRGTRLIATLDKIYYTKGKMDPTFTDEEELVTVATAEELRAEIEELRRTKTDRECVTGAGKSLVSNLEGDHGAVMKYEHVDGTWSGVGVHDKSGDGVAVEMYSVNKDTKKGNRLIMDGSGLYYTEGESDTHRGPEHKVATVGAIGNGTVKIVQGNYSKSFTLNQSEDVVVELQTGGGGGGGGDVYFRDVKGEPRDNAKLATELDKHTEKAIAGTNGIARIFNEADGGGSKFEFKDGTESFVGVNDNTGTDMPAVQMYVDKPNGAGGYDGTIINMYHDKAIYVNKANRASYKGHEEDYEIIVNKDVKNVLDIEFTERVI